MKNILLIGGLGFLGGRIAKYLSQFNYSIKITTQKLARKIPREYDKNIEIISLSYSSENQFSEVFKEIDFLIYLIGPDAHSDGRLGSNKISDYSSFSRRVVKYAELNGIRKIIYFSTVHVYGNNLIGIVDEKTKPMPIYSFANDHLKVEKTILRYTVETKPIILRCSNSFGVPYFDNDKCWSLAINQFCDSAFKNKSLIVKSANNFRDFIPIEDITLVVKKLIELEPSKISSIFNLSSSKTVRIIDIAKTIQRRLEKYFNHSIPIIQKSNQEKNEEINYFTIKNNLLKSLGFASNGIDKELDRLLQLCKYRYN